MKVIGRRKEGEIEDQSNTGSSGSADTVLNFLLIQI